MVDNVVCISDTHGGCKLGLCPPKGIRLDEGGFYRPSKLQMKLALHWEDFWYQYVPSVLKNEKYYIVHAGDGIDGCHHNAKTTITNNYADQLKIAKSMLDPIVSNKNVAGYFHIRGTEAHVGPSSEYEELLAKSLGARSDEFGNYARYELNLIIGNGLINVMHHIGTSSSDMYESTAVHKEMVSHCLEMAKLEQPLPNIIVRGHRHRYFKTSTVTKKGEVESIVLPGWQMKTPFIYKTNSKSRVPHFGGVIIRLGKDGLYSKSKVWFPEGARIER